MSVSSLEDSPVPVDLPAKYQKLAAEYAKIRAQFGVLKKAVIDEQNQCAELKETLRLKDQNLRKAEQELDSLTFRNQQLTKRVTVLQDELESVQNSSKSSKSKGGNKELKNTVIVEELQKKIAENASLMSALQEQTERYENEKLELNQKIEYHEHKLKEFQANYDLIEGTKITKYENENKALVNKLNAKDEEVKKLLSEIKQLQNDLVGRNTAFGYSALKESFSKLILNLTFQEFLASVCQFFQLLEFRYNKHMENKQFRKLLETNLKNRLLLKVFTDKYLIYSNEDHELDFLSGSDKLCESLQTYGSVLEEYSSVLVCSKDKDVVVVFKEIISQFHKHCLQLNSNLTKLHPQDVTSLELEEIAGNLVDVFRSFRGTCDYFLSVFNEKFKSCAIDKDSEKDILSILSTMSLQSSGIFKQLNENMTILVQVLEIHFIKLKQKNVMSQSNRCCENCKHEFESLKSAHSKKIKDLEEQISCLSEATTPRSTNSSNVVQSPTEEKAEPEGIAKDFEAAAQLDVSVVGEEAEIIKFYNARANKLVADRQHAESQVTALKDECEALQRRLEHSLESRLILEDSIKQAQNTVIKLQEELQTTALSYDEQLQSMSEHMANMNDKLASQQEEIEILKHQLTEKIQGIKKGKSN